MAKERTQKLPPKTAPKFQITLNQEQKQAANLINNSVITYLDGRAGSGKTLTALHVALSALLMNHINTIFITRPYVTADENMGFLPGDLKEKMDPYLIPIYDNLMKLYPAKEQSTGRALVDKYMEKGELQISPIGFMRGITFCNSYIILDEAQNITEEQLKMALTRIGKGSKMIICGDLRQCDLKSHKTSGIRLLNKVIDNARLSDVIGRFHLKENHRDPVVAKLLEEFEKI